MKTGIIVDGTHEIEIFITHKPTERREYIGRDDITELIAAAESKVRDTAGPEQTLAVYKYSVLKLQIEIAKLTGMYREVIGVTTCTIKIGDVGSVTGVARCSRPDQFCRKTGLRTAVTKAFDAAGLWLSKENRTKIWSQLLAPPVPKPLKIGDRVTITDSGMIPDGEYVLIKSHCYHIEDSDAAADREGDYWVRYDGRNCCIGKTVTIKRAK